MASLLDMSLQMFAALPRVLLSGWAVLLLLVAVAIVYLQYRRVATAENEIYGLVLHRPGEQTLYALLIGTLGGVAGSAVLSWTGIGLVELPGSVSALLYLWPVSILLGTLNPRYICFAYSGGLISLSYLLSGWPRVDVPSVLGLVAVLHMVESLLVRFSGDSCATPTSIQGSRDEPLPGHRLQRFWPVPLVLPFFAQGLQSGLAMPEWWPLLRPDPSVVGAMAGYGWQFLPVVVTMGYADLAISAPPGQRARASARVLLGYSLLLLALAVGAGYWRPLMWVGALFSALGHEAMAVWSGRVQVAGVPYLGRPTRGVGVLDVLSGSPAAAAGMRSGAVILSVDDYEVHSREQLHDTLMASPAYVRVMFRVGRQLEHARLPRPEDGLLGLGVILLPEPGDAGLRQVRAPGFFWWKGFKK